MTLLDAACTQSGTIDPETGENKEAAIVNVANSFIAIAQGDKIRVEDRKVGGGRRLFFGEGRAYDTEGHLIASATEPCRYI